MESVVVLGDQLFSLLPLAVSQLLNLVLPLALLEQSLLLFLVNQNVLPLLHFVVHPLLQRVSHLLLHFVLSKHTQSLQMVSFNKLHCLQV